MSAPSARLDKCDRYRARAWLLAVSGVNADRSGDRREGEPVSSEQLTPRFVGGREVTSPHPHHTDGPSRASSAAVWSFVSQAAVALANLPVTFMLARGLSPSGLGSFQLLNRLALVAIGLAHIGYPHALAWAAARARDTAELKSLYRKAATVSFIQGSAVLVVAVAILVGGWTPSGTVAWLAIAAYAFFNLMAVNIAAVYRGTLAIASFAVIRFSQALCWLVLTTYLFITGNLTVTNALLVLLVSQAASVLIAFAWTARRRLLFGRARFENSAALRRFSLRLYPGLTIREWNIYFVQIVIGFAFSRSDLGIFAVAAAVTVALGMFATPFINTAQPVIQRTPIDMRVAVTARLVASACGLVAVGAGALMIAAPFLIPWAYGSAYSRSVLLVQVLCLAVVVDAVNATLYGVLLGLDRPGDTSRAAVLGFGTSVVGWLVFLPTLGLLGAAVTSILAYVVAAVSMTRSASRALECSPRALWKLTWMQMTVYAHRLSQMPARAYLQLAGLTTREVGR